MSYCQHILKSTRKAVHEFQVVCMHVLGLATPFSNSLHNMRDTFGFIECQTEHEMALRCMRLTPSELDLVGVGLAISVI